jgi:crossover junction endodeoxyribonuclease RuvC
VTGRLPVVERILGIDPGMASIGFGVVEREGSTIRPIWYDCLKTKASDPPSMRLSQIHDAVAGVVAKFQPHSMAIEEMFPGVSAHAAMGVGQARGVCILACAQAGIDVAEYTPTAIKMAVTGYGRADKAQMQMMVQTILGLADIPRPDHAADALGIAICHAGSLRVPLHA